MLGQFWSGLGGKLAEQWLPAILTPAFVFWAGGLLAWGTDTGWDSVTRRFEAQPTPLQVALLVGALLLVLASGVAMQRLTFPALRLLEGYWPAGAVAEAIRARLVAHQARRWAYLDEQFQVLQRLRTLPDANWELSPQETSTLDEAERARQHDERRPFWRRLRARLAAWIARWIRTPLPVQAVTGDTQRTERAARAELEALKRRAQAVARKQVGFGTALKAELGTCEGQQRLLPADAVDLMPTVIGNVLRASERRIRTRFGLDPIVCWPRLWLVLPEASKADLTEARASVNLATQTWLWGLLFLAWSLWAWWAPLVTIVVLLFSYFQWLVPAAAISGNLMEAAFDVHRGALYRALRWPLPTDPADELRVGPALTQYLARGSVSSTPVFTQPPA